MPAISLPDVGFSKGMPRLVRGVSVSRTGQRAIAAFEHTDPFWQIDMTTVALSRAQVMLLEGLDAEAGDALTAIRYTVPRMMNVPQAYWADRDNAALSNDGNLMSVTNGYTVALNSVTNGLQLKRGDLFSLASGDYRSLHRVLVDATAASSAITLSVEPAVPSYITPGAVAKFKAPELNTRMLPGSFQIGDEYAPAASFTLVEVPK